MKDSPATFWRQTIICLFSGLLLALAFSTHSTGWLVWVAMTPWLMILFKQPQTIRAYAFFSWIFGMGFYIGVIHWLKELHPLTWLPGVTTPISLAIAYGGILGISLLISLWIVLLGGILAWLKPTGYRQIVYPALLWMLMEFAQAQGEVSLPWARLAVSQYQNLWLLQILPQTGQLVIAGLIVAVNASLAHFLLEFTPDRQARPYWYYTGFRALSVTAILIGCCLSYGYSRLADAPPLPEIGLEDRMPADDTTKIRVGVAQGNIPQGQKWGSAEEFWQNIYQTETIYKQLSQEAKTSFPDQNMDLLVWPESAIPVQPRLFPRIAESFSEVGKGLNTYFLTGSFDLPESEVPAAMAGQHASSYNGAVLVTPAGELSQWYYKRQRVPFGEFFPYRTTLEKLPLLGPLINMINPMKSDVLAGTQANLLETPFAKIGTLICFESVYPDVARASVKAGATMLVIVSNDGWYRDAIALYQHLGHGVLRAIENKRYVVRAGNTGISAFIDSYGQIHTQTRPLERTYLAHSVPRSELNSELTLYTRWGDWPLWLVLLTLLGWEIKVRTSKSQIQNSAKQESSI